MQLSLCHGFLCGLWLAAVLPAAWLSLQQAGQQAAEDLLDVVVVYSSDSLGFPALLNSMVSLARHLEDPARCAVHVIVPSADLALAERLLACFRRELPGASAAAALELELGVFYARQLAPPLVRGLYERNLSPWCYFNPGVVLLDLRRWRAENTTEAMERLLRRTNGWLADTLALNLAFHEKVHIVDHKWNFHGMGGTTNWSEYELALAQARILHWHGPSKPWRRQAEGKVAKASVNDHLYRAYGSQRRCEALD
mmetsp:Transcript_81058/g.262637  ORF Transcript_81058/g.262637 Transcript_81058/m.262637 type:complete len:254 (-) Transcript_81058:44-805(-)